MNELIPEMLDEKDMKSAWKNKPVKVIGLLLLFLVDWVIALIPAGFSGDIIERIKFSDNLKGLMDVLQNVSFFIIFIICLVLLIVLEYFLIGLIIKLKNK